MKLSQIDWPFTDERSFVAKIDGESVTIKYRLFWSDWMASKDLTLLAIDPFKDPKIVMPYVLEREDRWFGDV